MSEYIVVGSGFSGAVMARLLAEQGHRVSILEKNNHVGGLMYDYYDKNGILVHKYGPHVLMLNSEKIFKFLSKFCEFDKRKIIVLCSLRNGLEVPLPINLNSINLMFGKKSKSIIKKILNNYGDRNQVHILDLLNSDDEDIKKVAHYIYEEVFIGYNAKMWGLKPDEISTEVTGRSPIKLDYSDHKCLDKYEIIPRNGFTELFDKILNHQNIEIILNTNAIDVLEIVDTSIFYKGKKFDGKVIYTAPLDELFNFCYGVLPYRSVFFKMCTKNVDQYLSQALVSYPSKFKKCRSTDMKLLTGQIKKGVTTIVSEYPGPYIKGDVKFGNPAYPVLNNTSFEIIKKYKEKAETISNFYYIGRLAEFKYYNMEASIQSAFDMNDKIKEEIENE